MQVFIEPFSFSFFIVTGQVRGRPWSEAAAKRSNPTSKEQRLCGYKRMERSYSTFKVRRGGHEEIPLIQGKEQQLLFPGAAVKRYPLPR